MPRNVRPSWVELHVDGKKGEIATGPRNQSGEMKAKFYIRDEGGVTGSITVRTRSEAGKHLLEVFDPKGNLLYTHETRL